MELNNLKGNDLGEDNSSLLVAHENLNASEKEKEIAKQFFSTSYEALEQMKKEAQDFIDDFNEFSKLFVERKKGKFSIKKLIGMQNKDLEKTKEELFQEKFSNLQSLMLKFPIKIDIYEEKISEIKKVLLEYHDEANSNKAEEMSQDEKTLLTLNARSMLSVVELLDNMKNKAHEIHNNAQISFAFAENDIMSEKIMASINEFEFDKPLKKPDATTIDNIRKSFDQAYTAMDEIEPTKPKNK